MRFRARADDFDGLRVAIVRDKESLAAGRGGVTKRHRFRRRSRFIEKRRVGNVESGQIRDHGLEIEQRFEPPLRDLSLVRCVGSVPTGILENVSLDNRRRNAIGIARANKRFRDLIFLRNVAKFGERLRFRSCLRQIQFSIEPDIFWNGRIDQRVQRLKTDVV